MPISSKWSIDDLGPTGLKVSQPNPEVNALEFEADFNTGVLSSSKIVQAFPDLGKKFGEGTLHVKVQKEGNPQGDIRPATPRLAKALVKEARTLGRPSFDIITPASSESSDSEY